MPSTFSHRSRSVRLLGGASLAVVMLAAAGAQAQTRGGAAPAEVEEVIVTGSSIRGAAPVGSNLIAVGQADIAWVPAFAYVVANARFGAEARLQVVREAERYAVVVTRNGPGEPAKLSFHGMTEAAFEREADTVEAAYGKRRAFDGFVFHHYLGYRRFVGDLPPDAK